MLICPACSNDTLSHSEENVPSKEQVREAGGSLARALEPVAAVFLAYAGTFVSTGLLWYVHHSLLHVSTSALLNAGIE